MTMKNIKFSTPEGLEKESAKEKKKSLIDNAKKKKKIFF